MAKSMTGYGRFEVVENDRKFTVELKSVNNRYLDLNIRMPRQFNAFESKIRNELKNYITRGKVDVFINYEDLGETDTAVKYNKKIAQEYMRYLDEMAADFGLSNDVSVARLSSYPDVFTMEHVEENTELLWEPLKKALCGAAEQFVNARVIEGEFICTDLTAKLDGMYEKVSFIEERAPKIIEEYQKKLREKVAAALEDSGIDEARIAQEVVIYTDKICVDEEIVRLKSHIKAVKEALRLDESVGRKLDFLAQELNREANTILSKSADVISADLAIDIKTEIEKVREQIQNLE